MSDEHGTGPAMTLQVPDAVRSAWRAAPPPPAPQQIRRALASDVARFVVVLAVNGDHADVAPLSLDPALTTDEAYLLAADQSDLGCAAAVWLALRASIPVRLLERHAGMVAVPVSELRRLPQGRPLVSVLEERAEERAELADDMAELAAQAVAEPTLRDLLAHVSGEALRSLGLAPQLVFAIRSGEEPVTPEQAEVIAPLAGVTPDVLLRANPSLPPDLVGDLDSEEGRRWVAALAEAEGLSEADARRQIGAAAYALAARGPRGSTVWIDRISHYVRTRLGRG